MIWLILHDWLILLLAFLLGLFIGWWIWHRRSIDDTRENFAAHNIDNNTATATPVAAATSLETAPLKEAVTAPLEPAAKQSTEEVKLDLDLPDAEPIPSSRHTATTKQRPDFETSIEPTLYDSPVNGPADDLKKIKGIGPNYEKLLNEIGIYYYGQISSWTDQEISWLDHKLEFPGRIARDKWQDQARVLEEGGTTEFANRYDKGETPSSYKDKDKE